MIADRIYTLLNALLECGEQSFSDHFKICKCARDYINDHRGIDISLCDLCRQIGVSRRTLEYSFRYSIDQSPAAYLRSIKFNEIRRAFLAPDNAQKSIGDIVADWGIWHLSHFAQYYQKQFNELPSETRKIWQ
jgi:AraC family ethanolamine operon transcriptional activator